MPESKTIGDLIDRIKSDSLRSYESWNKIHLGEKAWGAERERLRSLPLTKESVIEFAQSVAEEKTEEIGRTFNEYLYSKRIKEGHDLLREIHSIAMECGIAVTLEEIDVPLTFSDAMIQADLLEKSDDNKVKLTEKGEATTKVVQNQIDASKK